MRYLYNRYELEECLIRNCNFTDLNLKKRVFCKNQILECDFYNTELSESDFSETTLTDTVFENCNLTKANFSDAKDYQIRPSINKIKKAIFTMPEAVTLLKELDIVIK